MLQTNVELTSDVAAVAGVKSSAFMPPLPTWTGGSMLCVRVI
jgi:hypothetical protein